ALFELQRVCDFSFMSLEFVNFRSLDIRVNTVFFLSHPFFIELKKVDYHFCLEYHMEKIIPNSSEMKR
ncbi:MAG: hypothetical protein E6Z87_04750, partial [Finegoldia magna]|nr:hypothetical protein [Finegoldia magna]